MTRISDALNNRRMTLSEFFAAERGAQAKLAAAMGIAPPLLSQWASADRQVPLDRCAAIERHTQGVVAVESLRADARWVRVKDKNWPHPDGRPLLDLASANDAHAKVAG